MNPFTNLRRTKFTVGGVLLASLLVFGFRGTMHRLTASLDQAREYLNDNTPVEHLISVVHKELQTAEQRLSDAEAAADSHRQQEERVQAEISQLQRASTEARRRLEILRPALTGSGSFQHAGCQFSTQDVSQDAIALAGYVKTCEQGISLRIGQVKELRQAVAAGDSVLEEARNEFALAKTRFSELEMKLRQQQAVAEATSAARIAKDRLSSELEGDFAGTVRALEKRLSKLQRHNESARSHAGGVPNGNIPFGTDRGKDAKALVEEVLSKSGNTTTAQVQ